ncbi:hypothetical protein [Photobacterium leiognathi]|uniref:hypothetical protein n=1 Tax=Photobacterium leiognathi TaxID=553611 RepID=UPI0029812869|nr:hypothetical protein [Photobacterium leiognathi]
MSKKNILYIVVLVIFIAFFAVKSNIRDINDTNYRAYNGFYLTDNTLYIPANDKYSFYNIKIYYKNGDVILPKGGNPRFSNVNKNLSDVNFYDISFGKLWGIPVKFSPNIEKVTITFFDSIDKTSSNDVVLNNLDKTFYFNDNYTFHAKSLLTFSPFKNVWENGFSHDKTTLVFVANFKNLSLLKVNSVFLNGGDKYKIVNVNVDNNRFIQVSLNKPVLGYDEKAFTLL